MAINGIGAGTGSLVDAARQSATQRLVAPGAKAAALEDRAAVTTTVAEIASQGAPIDSDRVAALRTAIAAGSYRADPQAIAARMIDGDLPGATL